MKQILILLLLIIVTMIEVFGQRIENEALIEKDTILQGIETKIKVLKVNGSSAEGMFMDAIIGFQNPVTKEWIWLDAKQIPFDAIKGFTNSFPLKIRDEFEGHDPGFFKAIAEPAGGRTFMWYCPCKQITVF